MAVSASLGTPARVVSTCRLDSEGRHGRDHVERQRWGQQQRDTDGDTHSQRDREAERDGEKETER